MSKNSEIFSLLADVYGGVALEKQIHQGKEIVTASVVMEGGSVEWASSEDGDPMTAINNLYFMLATLPK